jgi:MFS family permease
MNPWLRVFAPFAAGYYLSYLLRNVNAVIAPELTRALSVSAADLGLLTSAYLLAFGAFQLPLGLLLDRYGPRRVEAGLLLIAAAGCAVFSLGESLPQLAIARGLIGLGVSACLMASFKAFSLWFPAERQASLNAAVMAAGGLGALTATTPIGWALPTLGWRGIFVALALLVALVALLIFTTPDKRASGSGETLGEQWRALTGILKSRVFWRFAPQTAAIVGGFMALQGLWAVPWLTQVSGYTREAAAFHLLLTSGAMLAGFLAIAFFVIPLKQRGIEPETILKTGMGGGIVVMLLILAGIGSTHLLWFCLGLVFTVGNLAYALLSAHFPPQLSGRVNTALNLGAFLGAFGIQWGLGVLVDTLSAQGMTTADAYRWAFGVLLAIQAMAYGWFLVGDRSTPSALRA